MARVYEVHPDLYMTSDKTILYRFVDGQRRTVRQAGGPGRDHPEKHQSGKIESMDATLKALADRMGNVKQSVKPEILGDIVKKNTNRTGSRMNMNMVDLKPTSNRLPRDVALLHTSRTGGSSQLATFDGSAHEPEPSPQKLGLVDVGPGDLRTRSALAEFFRSPWISFRGSLKVEECDRMLGELSRGVENLRAIFVEQRRLNREQLEEAVV
ncbi:hypothetical protein FN846DRAFT_895440 [Sphaerosporella brunnea]|uniref:Uncharacterized protein n=1 Tax=Sphaerosporella brunnea TaxID=1250544 RepID=A0A5J5EG43_9PEZI|nr:hypothetical protein FN846DRAFT_895440 [Sphaerosporella brunnea]